MKKSTSAKKQAKRSVERSHDILRQMWRNPMEAIFRPRVVALIGASEREPSVGAALARNLMAFRGAVHFVNPRQQKVLGRVAWPSIQAVPDKVDLAIIATPAAAVPGVVRECAAAGVAAVIVISAGFKEVGKVGAELEQQVLAEAARGGVRVLGPNCLGVMSPHVGLNATFASQDALPGSVAFISQSGALCTAILDWSRRDRVGFSAFVSVGSMADVGWGELIDYLGDDPATKSILIYMESIGDPRAFLSAAREVARTKPVIVIKVGHTKEAARAAASHTGALTGSDDVLEAAFRRAGVLRVKTMGELFDMAEVLNKQPRPPGPRLAIVTNAGGPGALATDLLVTSGGELASLSNATIEALDKALPAHWSHGNPVDVIGDAGPERYAAAVEAVMRDEGVDGLLVVLTPQSMTDAMGCAEAVAAAAKNIGKPVLASWMGGPEVEAGCRLLNAAGIPTFDYPDSAARAFALMWRHGENLRALYETPALGGCSEASLMLRQEAARKVKEASTAGSVFLSKADCNQVLDAYDIPRLPMRMATSVDEAAAAACELGFPVVLKLHSETVTHKTEVGGVRLNLMDVQAVSQAYEGIRGAVSAEAFQGVTVEPMVATAQGYELIIGSYQDTQFGPVLLFGAGGQLVEVFKDTVLGLPPLNATLARRMIERTRIARALQGVRGRPALDISALEQLLVRFSELVIELPRIKEIDINPLLATPDGFTALDVRMVLHDVGVADAALPTTVIRPYPNQHVATWQLRDGSAAVIRPIRPEDEPMIRAFHFTLSERSVYQRYFNTFKIDQRIAHDRLARICFIDYDREMALVVERRNAEGRPEIIAVGRLSKLPGLKAAEFSMTISDAWQRHGLGTELLRRLVTIGREEGLCRITADILADNSGMKAVAKKAGFKVTTSPDGDCRAEIELTKPTEW
jgi:acetyltransferase